MKTNSADGKPVVRLIENLEANLVTLQADGDKRRRFEMLAYTGAPVQRSFGNMIIDLAGMTAPNRLPILRNHDSEQIVGQGNEVKVDASGVHISGNVSTRTAAGREVCDLSDDEFVWQASIGFQYDDDKVECVPPEKEVVVNGRKLIGPLCVVRRSQLRESSFVPVGADGDTVSVVFSALSKQEEQNVSQTEIKKPELAVVPVDAEAVKKESFAAGRADAIAQFKALGEKIDDPKFVHEQFLAGASVDQAERAWDKEQLARARKENEEMKAQLAAKPADKPKGTQPVEFTPAPEEKNFLQLADEIQKGEKCGREKAFSLAAQRFPDAYKAHIGR